MTDILAKSNFLPLGADKTRSSGWWGVWTLIVTEASLFGYLLLSYYYLWSQTNAIWPPEGLPKLWMPGINTVILLSSSVFVYLAERSIKKERKYFSIFWLLTGIAAGTIFVTVQLLEWKSKNYSLTSNLYGSLYFTITGFHLLHVVIGLIVLATLTLWIALGYYDSRRYEGLKIGSIYWHFVDAVWIFIFSTFFILPYLR